MPILCQPFQETLQERRLKPRLPHTHPSRHRTMTVRTASDHQSKLISQMKVFFDQTRFVRRVKGFNPIQALACQIYQNLIGNPKAGVSHDGQPPFRVDQANHFHGGRIGRGHPSLSPFFEKSAKGLSHVGGQ